MAEYVVEAIRGWRYNSGRRQKEYFIKWLNYPEEENTWEPEDNLNCPEILERFADNLDGRQLRYFHTTNPDKLTGFQRNATYVSCLGADGPHESDDEDSPKIDKQKFYCLVTFEDSDYAEEVTVKEFYRHKPHECMRFFEQRLIYMGARNMISFNGGRIQTDSSD